MNETFRSFSPLTLQGNPSAPNAHTAMSSPLQASPGVLTAVLGRIRMNAVWPTASYAGLVGGVYETHFHLTYHIWQLLSPLTILGNCSYPLGTAHSLIQAKSAAFCQECEPGMRIGEEIKNDGVFIVIILCL